MKELGNKAKTKSVTASGKINTSVWVPEDIWRRVRVTAGDRLINAGAIVEEALTAYFDRLDAKPSAPPRPPRPKPQMPVEVTAYEEALLSFVLHCIRDEEATPVEKAQINTLEVMMRDRDEIQKK